MIAKKALSFPPLANLVITRPNNSGKRAKL
jgi:hypothetical protein